MISRLTLDTELENEKYLLRSPIKENAQDFYRLIDEDVIRFMPFSIPKNPEESEVVIERMRGDTQDGTKWTAVIIEKVSGAVIGTMSIVKYFDDTNAVEIGYWLGKKHWGKGIMTEMARFLSDYAFSEMKVRKIVISAQKENIGSRKIAEKLGAKLDGILREDRLKKGKLVDTAHYSLFEDESMR